MPRQRPGDSDDDDNGVDPWEAYGEDLDDEQIEELIDYIEDFPELDYLDELDSLNDDEDFYGKK